jgi:enoyl-CoA hydratase
VQAARTVEPDEEMLAIGVGVDQRRARQVDPDEARITRGRSLDTIAGEPLGDLRGEPTQRVTLGHTSERTGPTSPAYGAPMSDTVRIEQDGPVTIITIVRPEVRNAVDRPTAASLADAFRSFEADDDALVAVLTGDGGTFCAGADLKGVSEGRGNRVVEDMTADGPMGPTRMAFSKPVIAAVEGFAVAGGLELALMCDLRVAATDAVFGVFCRRWGVPLIDGGTVRLPRMIGHSHALDLILTGRGVSGEEARMMGLVNRLTESGGALAAGVELAKQIAGFPQRCLRSDRRSSYEQWDLPMIGAMANETALGVRVIASGETRDGATRFKDGAGRHGTF